MTRSRCDAISEKYPTVFVTRTWRKDGSTNTMFISDAVGNLIDSGLDTRHQSPARIAERLILGGYLETRLAVFRVAANGGWE